MIIENSGGDGGGNTFIGFVLGGILVVVAIVGFFMWDNYKSHNGAAQPAHVSVNVKK